MAGVSAGAPAGGTAVRAPHLVRRFAGSLSGRPPSEGDTAWAHAQLTAAERALWDRMAVQDRRHSVQVARRFVAMAPAAEREAVAGALLHDVGKQVSGLGTFARVVLPLHGPGTPRLHVPASAVVRRAEMTGVYVLAGQGYPLLRQVRLGRAGEACLELVLRDGGRLGRWRVRTWVRPRGAGREGQGSRDDKWDSHVVDRT